MFEAAIAQGIFKLTLAIIGILIARLAMYWMDKFLVPKEFQTWLENCSDESRAIYSGLRLLALCLLVGLALS